MAMCWLASAGLVVSHKPIEINIHWSELGLLWAEAVGHNDALTEADYTHRKHAIFV